MNGLSLTLPDPEARTHLERQANVRHVLLGLSDLWLIAAHWAAPFRAPAMRYTHLALTWAGRVDEHPEDWAQACTDTLEPLRLLHMDIVGNVTPFLPRNEEDL